MKIRTLASIVIAALMVSLTVLPFSGNTTHAPDHTVVYHEAKSPTNYSVGWDAYETCENCDYSTFAPIPAHGKPQVEDFNTFVENLALLEELADAYAQENPGKEPLMLVIKYIGAGADGYNMSGNEDAGFAAYVKEYEEEYNRSLEEGQAGCSVTGLKMFSDITLPNGDAVNMARTFAVMAATYHNNGAVSYADASGWAGDIVDLIQVADLYEEAAALDSIEAAAALIREEYFLSDTADENIGAFSHADFCSDLDGYYILQQISADEYTAGDLASAIGAYMTEELTDKDRAEFFLKNRLSGLSTRIGVRDAVYKEYMGNALISTLEGTRSFKVADIGDLRKAACYAFADHICDLAGDYVELTENEYFTVFESELSVLAPGITQEIKLATTQDGKQIRYYIATGDVTNGYVNLYANYNENDPTLGWSMQRVLDQANAAQARHSDPSSDLYIENYNVVASVNGSGYNMTTGEPSGVLMMGGVEYHAPNGAGFFGALKDGTVVMGTDAYYYELKAQGLLSEAIAQFGTTLVVDGKIAIRANSNYYNDRASRTAAGITKTGKVVLMVLDGRQDPVSCGGSMIEIAHIMLEAGCVYAVNLDGGGSTTYVSKPAGEDELRVVSSPSDGYARPVSTSFILVSTAPSTTELDYADLSSEYQYLTVGAAAQITAAGVSPMGNAVEIPAEATWTVVNEAVGSVDENGVFTAIANGDTEVRLMLGGKTVGSIEMHVVVPDTLYFSKENINSVHGEPVELPVAALYENNPVVTVAGDIGFALSDDTAGSIVGSSFIARDTADLKKVSVTAYLTSDETVRSEKALILAIHGKNEPFFDFDTATGGDGMFAWNRGVSNSTTSDGIIYFVTNTDEDMITSYTFAVDMAQISVPGQITEFIPAFVNAQTGSLFELAEHISGLSTVAATLRFDKNFDVDYSNIEVSCEYLTLTAEDMVFNADENALTLKFRWIGQSQAIDPDMADTICLISGIKLTPKADAGWDKARLNAVNGGEIGCDIYMISDAFHAFALNENNQAVLGVYPFVNANDETEKGGQFSFVCKESTDTYTLVNALRSGWTYENGGWAYYVDGSRYTGVKNVDGLYYDFGADGINDGQTTYTGIFTDGAYTYYAKFGSLVTNGWYLIDEVMYHINASGHVHVPVVNDPVTCIKGGYRTYNCVECNIVKRLGNYVMPNGHTWDDNHVCAKCGTVGKNIADGTYGFGSVSKPVASTMPSYAFKSSGVCPAVYVTFDGSTALTMSSGASLNDDGTMRDLYVTYSNNRRIGKATVEIIGKGDYYGTIVLTFKIIPNKVNNFKAAEIGLTSATLSWTAAPGAEYYGLYLRNANGTNRVIATNIVGTSYKLTGLTPNKEYKYIIYAFARSTDGEDKTYNSSASDILSVIPTVSTEAVIGDCQVYVGDYRITDIRENDNIYLFLPANADLTALDFEFAVDSTESNNNVIVSGSKGSAEVDAANGHRGVVDITSIADANADGTYTVGVSVGDYSAMDVILMKASNVPDLFLTSDDESQNRGFVDADKSNEATAQMLLTGADGTVIYDGALTQLKARGNSTFAYYPKKSYQIKLDTKTDLLGNGEKVKTWVLLAGYGDATQMHDKYFKDLAAKMEMPYVVSSDWVNVWYDGEYRGVYLLSEKNSVGSTGIDITDLEEVYESLNPDYGDNEVILDGVNKYGQPYKYTDELLDPEGGDSVLNGGYLIELNLTTIDEASGFMTKQGKAINVKSPEYASKAAMIYISEYYQEFEDAVFAIDADGKYTGYNEATGKYFYDYVDLDSLVQVFLIQELGLNSDGFHSSLFFYKETGEKMYAGPIWDQEMTFGTGWNVYIASDRTFYNYLADALRQIPAFMDRVKEYYSETFAPLIKATVAENGAIDQYYATLADNAEMNYVLWPFVKVGKPGTTDHLWANGTTYDGVIDALRLWISQRIEILDDRYAPSATLGDVNGDTIVNSDDAVAILRYLAGYDSTGYDIANGDFNSDNVTNSDDAVAILRMLAGYVD